MGLLTRRIRPPLDFHFYQRVTRSEEQVRDLLLLFSKYAYTCRVWDRECVRECVRVCACVRACLCVRVCDKYIIHIYIYMRACVHACVCLASPESLSTAPCVMRCIFQKARSNFQKAQTGALTNEVEASHHRGRGKGRCCVRIDIRWNDPPSICMMTSPTRMLPLFSAAPPGSRESMMNLPFCCTTQIPMPASSSCSSTSCPDPDPADDVSYVTLRKLLLILKWQPPEQTGHSTKHPLSFLC